MNLKDLMSGIGVVIDDAYKHTTGGQNDNDAPADPIIQIVEQIEQKWDLRCLAVDSLPPEETWPGLLEAASFILLDWRLWPAGGGELEDAGIERNIRFLEQAKNRFVPVFIFTNEAVEDVTEKLPESVYPGQSPEKSFVFVRHKADLLAGDALNVDDIEQWVRGNASVYALKTWDRAFRAARNELFGSMYMKSPDWPRVFWKAYEDDGVDPSASLIHLINDSLRGRMPTGGFESEILSGQPVDVQSGDLRALIAETSVRPQKVLPEDEIGCGDMFRQSRKKLLLNLRPECDCVARDGTAVDDVELYCVEGKWMSDTDIRKECEKEHFIDGHFIEKVWEAVAFSVHEGKSVRFDFRRFRVKKFSELKDKRIGRLLHPYLTNIQQRFGLYLQRQGLPRIPEEAIPVQPPEAPEAEQ